VAPLRQTSLTSYKLGLQPQPANYFVGREIGL